MTTVPMAVHWAMISAVYPFWCDVARQTGRLLTLQDRVTQAQITNRLKEQYGDRQTVLRYSQYIIRSFVAWGVLKDSKAKGCYEKMPRVSITDPNLAILLFESALLASREVQVVLRLLTNGPAFFPFQLPVVTGDVISNHNKRIDVNRLGLEDELLKLVTIHGY